MSIKSFSALLALGVSSVAWAQEPVTDFSKLEDGGIFLFDDFADEVANPTDPFTSNFGLPWSEAADGGGGEETSAEPLSVTTGNSSKNIAGGAEFNAVKLTYALGVGKDYTPLASISAYVSPRDEDNNETGRDMSRCTELWYDYRGAGHSLILFDYDADMIGYASYEASVEASKEEWASAQIVLKKLTQPSWTIAKNKRDIDEALKKTSRFIWQVQAANTSGTLEVANVRCVNVVPPPAAPVAYINQVGYRPGDIKMFTLSGGSGDVEILDEKDEVVLTVTPSVASYWSPAGLDVSQVDISELDKEGTYKIKVAGVIVREDLKILKNTYADVAKASLKWYYYQRASIALDKEYAGQWARAAGHSNGTVILHESTGESGMIQSTKGWYDAGDYGRYTVNSGITTYTLLSLYEHFPEYFKGLKWNIPADGELPDLLAEIKWNLDWMLTMQAQDGGVYHKLTSLEFPGDVMPAKDVDDLYAIGKSTAGTFDFAAVMAVAARVYEPFDEEYAAKCLQAAKDAYAWGINNPDQNFTANPKGVATGSYEDRDPSDEKLFASTELFITTGDVFYSETGSSEYIPSWPNVGGLATYGKSTHATEFGGDAEMAKKNIITTADGFVNRTKSGFGVVIGDDNYVWGSNSVAANQGVWLLYAYYLTGDKKYYEAAVKVMDYLLGKNPLDMSFVTGTGTVSPMHPHHRPSTSDGVEAPVPGMLVGGPQPGGEDIGKSSWECKDYRTGNAATSYIDNNCSYATNEVAINWNAPLAYLAGALEALNAGYMPSFIPKAKNKYEITFVNFDGVELQSDEMEEGEMPAYEGETPTRDATAQYTYTFKTWDKDIVEVTEAATYTALFDSTVNKYMIKFIVDGNADSVEVAYGTKADSLKVPATTKKSTDKYSYTFKEWDKKLADVTETATYTALFDSTVNKYMVKFVVNGKVDSAMYAYGTKAADIKTPKVASDTTKDSVYTFKGWDKKLADVKENATYTATFKAEAIAKEVPPDTTKEIVKEEPADTTKEIVKEETPDSTEAIGVAALGTAFKFGYADNAITVVQSGSSMVRIQVFDLTGHLVESFSEQVMGSRSFSLGQFEKGSYLVRVMSKSQTRTARIVVK